MIRLIAAGIMLLLVLALFARSTVFSGNRIRAMRWRIRLYLHPGPGFASPAELVLRWGRLAADTTARPSAVHADTSSTPRT